MTRPLRSALPLVVVVSIAGCGDGGSSGSATDGSTSGSSTGVSTVGSGDGTTDGSADSSTGSPQVEGPTIRFNLPADGAPDPLEVPFPTDLHLGPDGTLPATLGKWDNFGIATSGPVIDSGLAGLDGFGRSVGAVFLLETEDAVDPGTLVGSETIAIVDIDEASPDRGSVIPTSAGYVAAFRTLAVQPELAELKGGRRYAALVTSGVRTSGGESLAAAPDLAEIANTDAAQRSTPAEVLYGQAFDTLAIAGFEPQSIAGLAVFTIQTRDQELRTTRDAIVAGEYGAAPQLQGELFRFGAGEHPGWTATLDAWLGDAPDGPDGTDLPGFAQFEPASDGTAHDAIGAVVSGTFPAPDFRRPFTMTADPEDGTFERGPDGSLVVVDPAAAVPVTFVLPLTPPPPEGWPVILFGHGTPSHRSYVMSVANELARAGFATVAIDAPEHGLRTTGVDDGGSAFRGSYRGPDGMADDVTYLASTLGPLGFFVNFGRGRDTRSQTILDYVQARRLVANPDLDLSPAAEQYGDATPRLDPDRIGWVGVSYGGLNGMVLAAVEPEIDAFVLDVGGGAEFVTIGGAPANLPQVDFALGSFGLPSAAEARYSRYNPVLTVLQMMFDATDPASFAYETTHSDRGPGPHLYVIAVDHDELVPNYGTDLVASLMGLTQVSQSPRQVPGLPSAEAPLQGRGATQALLYQSLGTHGRNLTSRRGERTAQTPFPREEASVGERIVYLDSPVTVRQPIIASQRSMVRFLETAWDPEGPVVDVTGMEFWFDFDDDGFSDEVETEAGTDPFDPTSVPAGPPTHPRDVGFE